MSCFSIYANQNHNFLSLFFFIPDIFSRRIQQRAASNWETRTQRNCILKRLCGSRPARPSCWNQDMDLNHQRQPDQPPGVPGSPRLQELHGAALKQFERDAYLDIGGHGALHSGSGKSVTAAEQKQRKHQKTKGKQRRDFFFSVGKLRLNTSANVSRLLSNEGFTFFFSFFSFLSAKPEKRFSRW